MKNGGRNGDILSWVSVVVQGWWWRLSWLVYEADGVVIGVIGDEGEVVREEDAYRGLDGRWV